jgi:hypothetical protein
MVTLIYSSLLNGSLLTGRSSTFNKKYFRRLFIVVLVSEEMKV